jgi:hypothetical protein
MQALMLVAESATLLPEFKRVLANAFPSALLSNLPNEGEFSIVFSPDSRVYVEDYGASLEAIGWEKAEITRIKEVFPTSHHVYSLAYHGIAAAKKVVLPLANSNRLMIDNDCGTLLPSADFVRKLLAEPTWNWFDDLQQHD